MRIILSRVKSVWELLRHAFLGTEKKFTTGSINRAIVLLAVPTVLEMAMEALFVCTNLFFISSLGENAIAVHGATSSVITFSYSISIGLNIAATAIISRRIGEKKYKAAGHAAMQIIYTTVFFALAISFLCVTFYDSILHIIGLSPSLVHGGELFVQLMFISIVFIIIRIPVNGIFRGAGDASIAMKTIWITNATNIALCPVLIYGLGPFPAMGIVGVAVATLVARVIGVIYQSWFLIKGKTVAVIGKAQLYLDLPLIKKALRLALAGVVQYMVPASSWLMMIKIVSHFGSHALAGYIIAQRVMAIAILPAWGIGNAAGILTGQNLGAGHPERAEASVWKAGLINMCFLTTVALLWWKFATPVVGIFSNEPEVINNGVLYILYMSVAYVLLAYTMVISRALNAAGNVKIVTMLYMLMFYVTQLPLSYFLGIWLGWGPKGIFTAILISEIVLSSACIIVFKRGTWKTTKV